MLYKINSSIFYAYRFLSYLKSKYPLYISPYRVSRYTGRYVSPTYVLTKGSINIKLKFSVTSRSYIVTVLAEYGRKLAEYSRLRSRDQRIL